MKSLQIPGSHYNPLLICSYGFPLHSAPGLFIFVALKPPSSSKECGVYVRFMSAVYAQIPRDLPHRLLTEAEPA